MPATSLEAKRSEFAAFVWNHSADAFQARFDTRAKLTTKEAESIIHLLLPANRKSVQSLALAVETTVRADASLLPVLLQMTGLTRNKILQDIKAYARSHHLTISLSSPRNLFNSEAGTKLASEYLARQLDRVYGHCGEITVPMLEAVNQTTWLGYIRQERAKRMGHEAEYRLACLLRDCDIPFAPEEKAENPLCRDIKINGISYDLVSPSADNALLRIKSTVHTANIGQYGESKDDLEIREANTAVEQEIRAGKNVTLLAFIDGVGFESNRAGLDGVLTKSHEFCQFRTLWKALAIAANKSRRKLTAALPKEQIPRFAEFAERYAATLTELRTTSHKFKDWIAAGDAYVRCRTR